MRLFEQQQLTDRVCWGARVAAFQGWIVVASQESIAHMQSPWPCPLRVLRRDGKEEGRPLGGEREESREKREQREEEREKRADTRDNIS